MTTTIHCTHKNCKAEFRYIAAREFPTLCIDHAAEASRDIHGWTPGNSVD